MSPTRKRFFRDNLLGISLTLIGLLSAAAITVAYLNHKSYSAPVWADGKALDGPGIDSLQALNRAYERIAQAMTPAIVSIQSTQVVKVQMSPFFSDPFFRHFFGNKFQIPQSQREHALGSGVLVTADGYILTNNHVIKNATSIKVMLSDKRTFTGKVVGADPQTDVAVIKIQGKGLPTASLGDSSSLHVGDIVMAFGNEFVYPKVKAVELAKANNMPVASMPNELAANTTKPAKTMHEPSVVAMKRAPLKAQKPTGEEVEIAKVFQHPPRTQAAATLPKTASSLPLLGLIGFLSLASAGCCGVLAARGRSESQ